MEIEFYFYNNGKFILKFTIFLTTGFLTDSQLSSICKLANCDSFKITKETF